jgi:ABC-type polysaccharide/polyol phosphate export permease
VAFAFSGFSIMWATRLQIMRSMFSIQIGLPLLYHRYVKATDIILAKGIIISFTTTLSFFIFLPFLIFFDFIDFPENVSLVVWSWILTQWYAFNFALITGAIAALYTIGNKICLVLNVGHAFITGCFYMVYWFSKSIQKILVLLPMVNACEMMRDGMFGSLCTTHYNIPYIILCNLALTYIGLVFCRKCANISSFKGLNG